MFIFNLFSYDLEKMKSDILKKDYRLFYRIIKDKNFLSRKYDRYLTNGQYIFRNLKDECLQHYIIRHFDIYFFYVKINNILYYIFLPENIYIKCYKLLLLRSIKILDYFRDDYHIYSIRSFFCTTKNFELFELYLERGLDKIPVDILLSYNNYSKEEIEKIMSYVNNTKNGKVHEKYQKLLYKTIIKNILENDLKCCKEELEYCVNNLVK